MVAADMTNMARIYEDIGALKALVASIDAKLDDGNREFRSLREEQVEMKLQIAEIKATGEARSDTMERIEDKVQTTEKKVDQLVALRHRVGGALFLMTLAGGTLAAAWSFVEKFAEYLSHLGK
jgi:chromosome segregation ATPase